MGNAVGWCTARCRSVGVVQTECTAEVSDQHAHLARETDDLCSVSPRWTSFVHELGGLLCASLNFVDSNVSSSSPQHSFRPQSTLPSSRDALPDNNLLRYAVLPREIVCTGTFFDVRDRAVSMDVLCSSLGRELDSVEEVVALSGQWLQ